MSPPDVHQLIETGEAALAEGDATTAFERLREAAKVDGVPHETIGRLCTAFAAAARVLGEQAEVLAWIDGILPATVEARPRAALLMAQMAMWSRLDTAKALALEPEAREAARAIKDVEGEATVLALAAFVAYRRGEVRKCREIADAANELIPETRAAQYQVTRAQMFAATAAGELEATLNQTIKARAMARELGRATEIANESNNLAEIYLELGYPHEARACAETAQRLAKEAGHAANEVTGQVLAAIATAELGEIDAALSVLELEPSVDRYPIVMIDAACACAYWLLERGAAGDARRARERAQAGLALAERAGVGHRLTALHASLARAHGREANHEAAREALELARRGADKVEPTTQSFLALAAAEVLEARDTPRQVILASARVRILRAAARREDPLAFCTGVRLNRRLLELTGGVPEDLPGAA